MIEAVIFDFDGLILDTETPTYEIFAELFRDRGAELPIDVWANIVGSSDHFDVYRYMEEKTGAPIDHDAIVAEVKARYLPRIEASPPLPGVPEMIASVVARGLRRGVASSSGREWVTGHLERLGLIAHFEQFATGDEVEMTKPDPALFFLAAERLNVAPRNCLVFEDSRNGLVAAKAAGMHVAIIPNAITRRLDFSMADFVLGSMAERSLDSLIEELAAGARG